MKFAYKRRYVGGLKAVVLDWAGTTVDYGCIAPVQAFVETFRQRGVDLLTAEAREPMGLNKRDHIRAITKMARVAKAWERTNGRPATENDVEAMYHAFLPIQLGVIRDYAQLIDGTLTAVEHFRSLGLKIGTTTGYSREMMEALLPEAERQGYKPDAVICASDVKEGRPSPFMVHLNAIQLGVYPLIAAVKIGDTVADVEEGLNAGMWTIGLAKCGNELGLSEKEAAALPPAELDARVAVATRRLAQAGAHYVVPSIGDVIPVVNEINQRLAHGETP